MATMAQIQANRSNAQKSTGPRTAEGKERASQNALKHGLLAREAVIQGEDPAEFEAYREGMLQGLAPAGAVETMLAERVVGLSWRLQRAERLQNAAFAALDDGEPEPLLEARLEEWKQIKGRDWDRGIAGVVDENAALGKLVVEDFAEARVLDRLLMYEWRIESSLYRTMAQLRQEREARPTARSGEASRLEGGLLAGQEAVAGAELGSFGAKPSSEGTASASCQALGRGPSDFTLQTSHFKLAEEKITPYGVTTNEEKIPPCDGAANAADGDHGRDARAATTPCGTATDEEKITPYGVTTNEEEIPPCGSGANAAAGNHGRDAHATHGQDACATRTPCGVVADVPAEQESCETNPISGGVFSWACHSARSLPSTRSGAEIQGESGAF